MGRPIAERLQPLRTQLRLDGATPWLTLLAGAALVFIIAQVALNTINAYWIDEYFSTWISDPSRSFGPEFFSVVVRDTNPPIYFTALRLMRGLIAEPRVAYITLDAIILVATAGFVAWTALRAKTPRLAAAAFACFVMSGPVMIHFPEGRTYFLAVSVAFSASWTAALVLIKGGERSLMIALGVLGGIGALTHVFCALYLGCLGAGIAAQAALSRRRDLLIAALALGGTASLVFVIWFKTAPFTLNAVSWIEFTYQRVLDHIWTLRRLTLGPTWMAVAFLALLIAGLRLTKARPIVTMFGVTMALFFVLPILISFKTPVLTGRYWSVGGPVTVIVLVLLAREFLLAGGRWARFGATGAAATLALASIFGMKAAWEDTGRKPRFEGAPLVAQLARDCGPGAINAGAIPLPPFAMTNFMPGFQLSSGLPADRFVDVDTPGHPVRTVTPDDCAVVGWREHHQDDASMAGSDESLLAKLHLRGPPGLLRVVRYRWSFVVLNTAKAPVNAGVR